jgi:hypothetical protein
MVNTSTSRRAAGDPDSGGVRSAAVPKSLFLNPCSIGVWALDRRGIYFLEVPDNGVNEKVRLKFFELSSKRVFPLTTLDKRFNYLDPAISLSPDGRHLVFEQDEQRGSNIVLVENFR